MRDNSSINTKAYKTLSRAAVYIVLLAWVFLGLYIVLITQHEGLDGDILKYFISIEQSGIKFRALLLLGPFFLTVVAYLINEKTKFFQKTLLAEEELRKRALELEKINELLIKESNALEKAEEQLTRQAFYDTLTNLPNRALFMDRLQSALEHKKRYANYIFAVLFLDVDRFKVINDGLGHFIGDQLLILISQRLKKCIRNVDTVSRFGGDEFAILMDDATHISQVSRLADRIKDEMSLPFNVLGREIFATVSVGIILSNLTDYSHPDELIRDADIAMYQAKARGKACHVIFDSAMHAEAKSVLWLETDLRRALGNNEFIIHYQPIISMKSNEIIGFEALVRWQHPSRGLLPPLDFMMVAEATGLIVPIGQWVLLEACRQLRQWQEQFPEYRNLTVSVNISSKIFSQADFYDVIVKILNDTGLKASSLRLEIVERMLIDNPEPAAALLKRLQDLDIRIDIDDFGTGYSALNYLRHFPIHGLKIDRSFISALTTDKNNAAIVKTIIALSHDLSLDVIAEGIETTEQMDAYRALKGGYAQGYFISRPVHATAIENMLNAPKVIP
jgi:diguanylate cyclase (GGDEF)-like protein